MFDPPAKKNGKITFAKIATILAVTGGISFGLCTAGLFISPGAIVGISDSVGTIASASGAIAVICVVGLVLLGIIFLIKEAVGNSSESGKD